MHREQREEEILLSLKKLHFLSRSQLQRLHNLKSKRNANRILKEMEEYLSKIRQNEYIYYLSKEGRERVACEKIIKKTSRIDHYLMRNDLYIHLGRPITWRNEVKVSIPNTNISVIPDASFNRNRVTHFVEVDNKQTMFKNSKKIDKYKVLAEYNNDFKLIFVTTTPYRKKRLETLSEGLNTQIYLWEDIK